MEDLKERFGIQTEKGEYKFPCIRVQLLQGDNVIDTYLPEGGDLLMELVRIFVTTGVELRVLNRDFRSF